MCCVYVADPWYPYVQEFTPDGAFVAARPLAEGRYPFHLAVDDAGNFYVFVSGHRIQKYAPDWTLVTQWGERGAAQDDLLFPSGTSVDREGIVYVCDTYRSRIQVFEPGQAVPTATPTETPAREPCSVTGDKQPAPLTVEAGESVQITLSLEGTCTDRGAPADVVLVVHQSDSMTIAMAGLPQMVYAKSRRQCSWSVWTSRTIRWAWCHSTRRPPWTCRWVEGGSRWKPALSG